MENVNKNMYHISSIKSENQEVFWTFHVAVMQINGKEMYKRKRAAIRPIVVFFHSSGQGHSTTVFCKISVRRSKFRLEFSFTWLKISR